MKFPKKLNKMSLDEQESWLVGELFKVDDQRNTIVKQLAKVRGGMKIQVSTEERPDLEILKAV
jgi:hypothetical protein